MRSEAGAVAFVDGLVALRRTPKGEWLLPKGHIEPGEEPAEAALRELEEETGLLGNDPVPLGTDEFTMDGDLVRVVYFAMSARPGPGWREHKGRDAFLVPPDEALRLISFDGPRSMVAAALGVLKQLPQHGLGRDREG